jgi:hypothetical protein
MNGIVIAVYAILLASSLGAAAADTQGSKSQTNRMSQCSTQAKEQGLKGDARKEFMSQCLRDPAARTAAKECSSAAAEKGLKGAQRKAFVDDCVKSKTRTDTMG